MGSFQASMTVSHLSEPSPPIAGNCLVESSDRAYFMAYVLLLLIEAEIFIFTAYRVHVHYRHQKGYLMMVMAQHGILYFIFALLFSLTNILVILLLPTYYSRIFGVLQTLSHALVVTRMQLQLWTADHDRLSTSLQIPTSTIAFATPEESTDSGLISRNNGE
ncbi:hypothetical protein BJ138DRAFT_1119666 [Hygrophoropsis aurantiaca]|uniref:Uncharacterized protein n=1 Tax=Hygrophoropsis aurantiaca TaxID=72124 RepID=A0ACB7ZTH6_9AGAM|nr:hypothetical protein BJ138DRAFT_1119666 [Hygrophoropsis aurantiaca]